MYGAEGGFKGCEVAPHHVNADSHRRRQDVLGEKSPLCGGLLHYHLALVVHLALMPVGTVHNMRLACGWTNSDGWSRSLIVGSPLGASRFRMFVLWIWHFVWLLFV